MSKIDSKSKTNALVFSLYGKRVANNDLFLSFIGSIGINKVKSTERRAANVVDYANADYKSYFHSLEVTGGKDFMTNGFQLTPIVGLRYAHSSRNSYAEKDSLVLNTSISGRSRYVIDGILGGKVKFTYNTENGYKIIPEVSGFAYLNLDHKTPDIRISSNAFNNPVTLKAAGPSKVWYSVGTGVSVLKSPMEYRLSYAASFDKKYFSHQVAAEFRVNF